MIRRTSVKIDWWQGVQTEEGCWLFWNFCSIIKGFFLLHWLWHIIWLLITLMSKLPSSIWFRRKNHMKQPEGFITPEEEYTVCNFLKSLHSFKEASNAWHEKFEKLMLSHGLRINGGDIHIQMAWEIRETEAF